MSFAIRGGLLVDPTVPVPHVTDIVVDDAGVITEIGPGAGRPGPDDIDATGTVVTPGFVDTHRHTWQTGMRATAYGWDLWRYMTDFQMALGPQYTPEDVYVATLLGALTALDSGITTLRDESHVQNSRAHTVAAIDGLRASGIRARFDYGWPSSVEYMQASDLPHPRDMERVRSELLPDDDALVTLNAHLRGPGLSLPDTFRQDLRRARALGLRSSIHAGIMPRDGSAPPDVAWMHDEGLLGEDITLVHCARCTDDELRMMAATGTHVSVTAAIETLMPGLGAPSVARMTAAGLRPSFGVDVEVAAAGDMFGVVRAALLAAQLDAAGSGLQAEQPAPAAADLLEFAGLAGARACGLADRVGTLEVGKEADLLLVRLDDVNMLAPDRPREALCLLAHPGNVDTVLVRGEVRKRGGALVGVDLGHVRGLLARSWERLKATSPVSIP